MCKRQTDRQTNYHDLIKTYFPTTTLSMNSVTRTQDFHSVLTHIISWASQPHTPQPHIARQTSINLNVPCSLTLLPLPQQDTLNSSTHPHTLLYPQQEMKYKHISTIFSWGQLPLPYFIGIASDGSFDIGRVLEIERLQEETRRSRRWIDCTVEDRTANVWRRGTWRIGSNEDIRNR